MIKKLGMWFILLALVIQLLPTSGIKTVNAATGNFTFPSESDDQGAPRITTDERVTLTGTINNVDPSSISYSTYQIVDVGDTTTTADDETGSQRENLTSNITITGSSIEVFNIQLFPGLNKITFQGTKSGGQVSNSIYIEYRNGPMLYDLTANLNGNSFPIVETGTTVVQSSASNGRSTADISILGKAPNASSVTIVVNGNSKTYSVNSADNNSFIASPINIKKGKNLVIIKVSNGTQVIETSRDIAFYNGSVTFYDVNANEKAGLNNTVESAALEYSPNFSVDPTNNTVNVTGKVIVPNSYYMDGGSNKPHPDPAQALTTLKAVLKEASGSMTYNLSITSASTADGSYTPTDSYFVYSFTVAMPSIAGMSGTGCTTSDSQLCADTLYNLQLTGKNEVNDHLGLTPVEEGTNGLYFSLRDASLPYVAAINYLPGYKSTSYEGITGTDLNGATLYGLPIGIEVLVGNPAASNNITVTSISDPFGKTVTPASTYYTEKKLLNSTVTRTVNGTAQTFYRVVLEFPKLPFEGKQTINLKVNSSKDASATFTVVYGVFVNFDKAFDGMSINDDTTLDPNVRAQSIIGTSSSTGKLGLFAGEFFNVSNSADIRYKADNSLERTVFFYINNVPIPIVPQNSSNPNDPNFILDTSAGSTTQIEAALGAMFSGKNEIKIVFQTAKTYYEKKIIITLIPTNLPVIPRDASGVYPFTYNEQDSDPKPIANDPNFTKNGSLYTTTQSFMNIYGTFDFIDLGTDPNTVETKLTALSNSSKDEDYILKISATTLSTDISWNLSQPLQIYKGSTFIKNVGTPSGNLVVRYDVDSETFSFLLKRQELNADGSSSVYVFSVYNSGEFGPKATYRLEVDPTALPYKILRPYLPAEGTVNKNFVEVIINAKGAKKVTINKQAAEKFSYDYNNDGVITDGIDYPSAFRTTISGLKAGSNKISFTIENDNDKVSNSFNIVYVPTNIPGAEFMETMKNSHKIFEGALNLTFPKGTSLIRTDYNNASNLKDQVYTGNKLLFAIANPNDGIVDRREYEIIPANFDLVMQSFGARFRASYPTRFTKASPVFWIDAGLADDLSTPGYDPLSTGVDPYQYPGATGENGTKIPTYDDRPSERELVASKRGTLAMAFDPNVRSSAGTIITVFRYDQTNKTWVNLGGVVDTKKNTISVPFDKFGYYVVGKLVYSFSDVTGHPYARNYMEAAFSKGVMNAANFDDFGADMYTSRGEFTRMIVKSLDIPLKYNLMNGHFDDVQPVINPDGLWDYSYIETAANEGIVRGTGPRTFSPSLNLSRQDASVFLARALNLKLETDSKKIDAGLQKLFKDYSDIDYYAKASVLAIAKKGYIQGSPLDASDAKKGFIFEPTSNLLRSDAAILMGKVLADLKRFPKLN
ncbi:S-layer homology domain-containing protein [Paenibacillus sp. sptzw28]|uniref:S-layer homology domain-containing protein n=1 Tax=Paenibacillus sp. sptzw28 TaxID=715179 RepID=UPI001C6ED185|nr:S-layer homology domain-containing protein [Paenibacillus sp. sptzw28]QYR22091.1 S-layer homology domain-containing protein [Paenibacillus sp. sptzw28]